MLVLTSKVYVAFSKERGDWETGRLGDWEKYRTLAFLLRTPNSPLPANLTWQPKPQSQ
jgi:hypothetical protein